MTPKMTLVGLCGPGRHEMPVQEYVFPAVVENPMDFEALNKHSFNYIKVKCYGEPVHIMLFVTGLTPVLASFLSVWVQNASQNDKLTLMHYDRDEGDYVGQDFWGSSQ